MFDRPLRAHAERTPDKIAMRVKRGGAYQEWSYSEVWQRVQRFLVVTLSPQRTQKGGSTRGIWVRHLVHAQAPIWRQPTQRGGNKRSSNCPRRLRHCRPIVSMMANTDKGICSVF